MLFPVFLIRPRKIVTCCGDLDRSRDAAAAAGEDACPRLRTGGGVGDRPFVPVVRMPDAARGSALCPADRADVPAQKTVRLRIRCPAAAAADVPMECWIPFPAVRFMPGRLDRFSAFLAADGTDHDDDAVLRTACGDFFEPDIAVRMSFLLAAGAKACAADGAYSVRNMMRSGFLPFFADRAFFPMRGFVMQPISRFMPARGDGDALREAAYRTDAEEFARLRAGRLPPYRRFFPYVRVRSFLRGSASRRENAAYEHDERAKEPLHLHLPLYKEFG